MAAYQPDMIDTGVDAIQEVCQERIWKIRNSDLVFEDDELIKRQQFQLIFNESVHTSYTWQFNITKTICQRKIYSSDPNFPAIIRIGFDFTLIWKLSEVKGCTGPTVKTKLEIEVKTRNEPKKVFEVSHNFTENALQSKDIWDDTDLKNVLLPDGTTVIHLKLTILRHCDWVKLVENQEQEEHQVLANLFHTNLCTNLKKLLFDKESSDLTIVTSDGKELFSHKFILKLQNPVFATMLRSDFKESRTGIANVDDVCGKTMEIILRYLYTGELLPTWSDADIIVEFTYAAGKYQLTEVLQMLDKRLLKDTSKDYSSCRISLLSLTSKLSLKNAEARILEQVSITITGAKTADELFDLISSLSLNIKSAASTANRSQVEKI